MTQDTTYEPKVGDFVDLKVRGKVTTYRPDTGSLVVEWGPNHDHLVTHSGQGHYRFTNGEEGITVAPAAMEPEPAWQPGDVVKVPGYLPFIRTSDDRWVGPADNAYGPSLGERHSLVKVAWNDGSLEVLYKREDS